MVVKKRAFRENAYQVALLNINIPMLYARVGVVQPNMPFGPKPGVAAKQLQHVGKPFIMFFRLKYRIVYSIMKSIYEQYYHGKACEYIKKEQQLVVVAK